MNGFGDHRIEGIGDKHVPWVHNVRNTDAVAAIDDEDCMRILRLFNEPAGRDHLASLGVDERAGGEARPGSASPASATCWPPSRPPSISSWTSSDVIFTVFTDSTDLYESRAGGIAARTRRLPRARMPWPIIAGPLAHQSVDYFKELTYPERKAIHNLKYYTWVEQQGKTVQELTEQWNPEYWRALFEDEVAYFDQLIEEFNQQVRLCG